MTDASSGEASDQQRANGTAGRKEMVELAGASMLAIALQQALKQGLLGIAAAAAGWLAEWFAGPVIEHSGLGTSAASQPFAALVLVVTFYAVVGAIYGIFAIVLVRRLIDGKLMMRTPEGTASRIRPAWWGAAIRDAAVVFAIASLGMGLWALGQWLNPAERLGAGPTPKEMPQYLAAIAGVSVLAGVVFRFVDVCEWLFGFLKPVMMRLAPVWFTLSAVGGAMSGMLFFGVLVGLAALTAPLFAAAGLGSPLRLALMVGALPLALKGGVDVGQLIWEDRKAPKQEPEMWRPESQDDFRNWDLKPETSISGRDANDLPFVLWRESADDRVGLSRPRYCCITQVDGELHFTFFNPSEGVRPTGAMVASLIVAALIVARSLAIQWFSKSPALPYVFDQRPPPAVVFLDTAISAAAMAGIVGICWYALATMFRWYRNRFEGDGRIFSKPLRLLAGFADGPAGALGATINGEEVKSGHGLIAAFEDGSIMILTANAWNYKSIVGKHAVLNEAFREPRDDLIRRWDAQQKETADSMQSVTKQGRMPSVPDVL